MKSFFRVMLGAQSTFAEQCLREGFIGADFGINENLREHLTDDYRIFNKRYIPLYLSLRPEKTKVSAGLACGALWTISKGIRKGDIVICPNGDGEYLIGEVVSGYVFEPGTVLPHRRQVKWHSHQFSRASMSQALRNSTGSLLTVCSLEKFRDELEKLCLSSSSAIIVSTDETVEDASTFALEKHLESFLVENWKNTELGKNFDVLEDEGKIVGQQFPTDTGPIDILAISKDKKTYLVVELKKGRASDAVVGQVQRYMGYVQEEVAEELQVVKGVIIALEEDPRILRALSVTQNIDFFKYQVSFKLNRASKSKAA